MNSQKIKGGPPATINYVYDGTHLGEQLDGTGSVVARYVQGRNIDEALAELRSGTASYYEQDGLGSPTSLSSSTGAIATSYTYDSFGNLTASTGSITNPFQFTGREYYQEAGLYYLRARYLNPTLGKFISEDPIQFGSATANFYGYVHNSPADLIDPFGLAQCVYSVSIHTMVCGPNANGMPAIIGPNLPGAVRVGPDGLHSGANECKDNDECVNTKDKGPITPGYYRMNFDTRPEHTGWNMYRLESWPHHWYDGLLFRMGEKRGGFELHIGSITYGCINADKTNPAVVDQFHQMLTLLQAEDGNNFLTVLP